MKTITEHQAIEQFDEYSKLAHDGERILVTRSGLPWVTLAPPAVPATEAPGVNELQWPDFAARLAKYYPKSVEGPSATELLAQDKEDRF
jgi:hypothetical protein